MGNRHDVIPPGYWPYLGTGMKLLDADLTALETGGTGGSDITVKQNTDGSWPTVTTRKTGAHYRWLARYDVTKLPTSGNGAASGDELVGPDQTVLP